MMIPEYSPRGTSITYRNATAIPPTVYRMSLKPSSPTTSTPVSPSSDGSAESHTPLVTAVVYGHSRPSISTSSSTGALAVASSRSGHRRVRRLKSYSESGMRLERMLPAAHAPTSVAARARPHSAGHENDLTRVVTISGFSKNAQGTWMFRVDVGGHNDSNAYVIRRRFTDFKLLHEGLSHFSTVQQNALLLPDLPPHGLLSVFHLFVAPEKALAARAASLQQLLLVVHAHPTLSRSAAFSSFIGKNPSSLELGYVSLSCYEAPTSDRQPRLSFDTSRSV
ncbi:hypothetical protein BBJ28_00005447 [Nothophytophthora sp. Chile5]|nr:hypothetical protein BBJ28_00005447 [Nothophytophthora sp. Chile5]